jgi:hypothetical protein
MLERYADILVIKAQLLQSAAVTVAVITSLIVMWFILQQFVLATSLEDVLKAARGGAVNSVQKSTSQTVRIKMLPPH